MTKEVSQNELTLRQDRLATLGILSAGLAHEINNPLAYVLANVRFLSREILELKAQLSNGTKSLEEALPQLSEWAEVLAESIEGVQNISKLVRDMKGFARGGTHQLEWFELQEVIEASLRIVRHEMKHRIALTKRVDTFLPCLYGNPSQLQQVFVNLLMNAAQAMDNLPEAAGKVDIVLTRKGAGVSAIIKDNGRGIPAEHMDKLFLPFFTSKSSEKGTGLGLFICNQLVGMHGGRLRLESHTGKGTTVHVWLPVQNAKASTEEFVVAPM